MKENTLRDFEAALDAGELQQAIDILREGGAASAEEMNDLCEMLTTHHTEDDELREFFPHRIIQTSRGNGRPSMGFFKKKEIAKDFEAKVAAALKIEGKKYLALQRVSKETGVSVSRIKRALRFLVDDGIGKPVE